MRRLFVVVHLPDQTKQSTDGRLSARVDGLGTDRMENPNNISNLIKNVWELLQAGDLEKAGSVCREGLAHAPQNADLLLHLGLVERKRGDRVAAINRFRAALQHAPAHRWAILELASDLAACGQVEEARTLCLELAARAPADASPLVRLGRIANQLGDYKSSLAYFEAAWIADPSHPTAENEMVTARSYAASHAASVYEEKTTSVIDIGQSTHTMNNKVFRSKAGFLYLTGGTNAASRLYTRTGFEAAIDAEGWRRVIETRMQRCDDAGIQFRQLIIPEKLAVVPLDEEDRKAVFGRAKDIVAPGERLLQSVPAHPTVYPRNFLVSQFAQFPVYGATDSHWTWTGAFSAFQMLMSRFALDLDYAPFLRVPRTPLTYHGDLWDASMADMDRDRFERLQLPASIRRLYCNAMVGMKEQLNAADDAGLHVGSQCVFHNANAQRAETVVLFGTSFSEYRLEPSLLTAIFAFFFETVHFVWSTSLDFGYIERHKPDLVVAELPERFLTYCPDDKLDLEAFTVERIATWRRAQNAS